MCLGVGRAKKEMKTKIGAHAEDRMITKTHMVSALFVAASGRREELRN
jgi:hypothetical protein